MNIIELAKEAGFVADHVNHDTLLYSGVEQALERFAALVREHTLQEAAQACDDISIDIPYNCAAAIRSLK